VLPSENALMPCEHRRARAAKPRKPSRLGLKLSLSLGVTLPSYPHSEQGDDRLCAHRRRYEKRQHRKLGLELPAQAQANDLAPSS